MEAELSAKYECELAVDCKKGVGFKKNK